MLFWVTYSERRGSMLFVKCPICSNNNTLQRFEHIKFVFGNRVITCGECHSKLRYNLPSLIISELGAILLPGIAIVLVSLNSTYTTYYIFFLLMMLGAVFMGIGTHMSRILVQQKGDCANKAQSGKDDDQEKPPIAGGQ